MLYFIYYCWKWRVNASWIEIPAAVFVLSNHLKTFSSSDQYGQKASPGGWFARLINQATNGCCSCSATAGLSEQTNKQKKSVAGGGTKADKSTINCRSAHLGFTPQVKHQWLTWLNTTQRFINRTLQAENRKKLPTIVPLLSWKADAESDVACSWSSPLF